jgi:hypothetical protein
MDHKIKKIEEMKDNTREELDRYLADVCQVVRDKGIKKPNALTERLLKESFGRRASSVFAFVPCIVDTDRLNELNQDRFSQLFGFSHNKEDMYHTNLRELLNLGMILDEALKYVDFTHYKAYTAIAPYFIYQQIRTHSQVQFLSNSARFSDVDYGYFAPNEIVEYIKNNITVGGIRIIPENIDAEWGKLVESMSPFELKHFMSSVGVKRKGILNRGVDMLKIRPFAIGFNTLNPNSFEHFYRQRTDKHTQLETREFVEALELEVER